MTLKTLKFFDNEVFQYQSFENFKVLMINVLIANNLNIFTKLWDYLKEN